MPPRDLRPGDGRISLRLNDVEVKDALRIIAKLGNAVLFYNDRDLAAAPRVTLKLDAVTPMEAIRIALGGTKLVARATASGIVVEAKSGGSGVHAEADTTGVVKGTVSDSSTKEPIAGATISIVGGEGSAVSGPDGHYSIPSSGLGRRSLLVRRLGYRQATVSVTVSAAGTTDLDIVLVPAPRMLDQIVTTATGDQRKLEVGNQIYAMRVDSLVATMPVKDVGQVLSGRVPGVQVYFNGGMTGAAPQVNIRGQNSLSLSSQPLLIVDGVRVANSEATNLVAPAFAAAGTGRFNDVPVGDIATVEVVKGPSAATLYGTDAANGVILITTKHGATGAPALNIYAEGGLLAFDRSRFEPSPYPWGHLLSGATTPMKCPLLSVASGVCAQDSITRFSPLLDPETTPLGHGDRTAYGIQVSGGESVRYFLSGFFEDEVGYLKMPTADARLLAVQRGGAPLREEEERPNAARKYGLRANMTVPLTPTANVQVSSAIMRLQSRIPNPITLLRGAASTGIRDGNDGWMFGARPGGDFVMRHRQQATHFIGGLSGTWKPVGWLDVRLNTGLDFTSSYLDELNRAGEGFQPRNIAGARSNAKTNNSIVTVDGGVTATLPLITNISSRSSAGIQYTRGTVLGNTAAAQKLSPGTETVAGGAIAIVQESTLESVVAGTYFEETLGYVDRLFLTGAVRVDGSSSFGKGFGAAVYPKASASWLVSKEPFWPALHWLDSFRFRAAYGESGVQPGPVAALATEALSPAFVDGTTIVGAGLGSLANRELRPERQRELEGGFDAEMFDQRVTVSATYYRKRSTDALVNLQLPASLGGGTRWDNIGSVENWGYEAAIHADLTTRESLRWSVQLNGSINNNKVRSIGQGVTALYGSAAPSVVQGKPLYSYFDFPILHYEDANHDGIIDASEVTIGDSRRFAGRAYPRLELSAGTSLGLFDDRLVLSLTADHRGDVAKINYVKTSACVFDACDGAADPSASLAEQAAVAAAKSGRPQASYWGFIENASFTRLRELSLAYTLPRSIASVARADHARLILSGRNIALWSPYTGVDPEVQTSLGRSSDGAYYDSGGLPPATYWLLKLELGF